jgi:hypothetical protein
VYTLPKIQTQDIFTTTTKKVCYSPVMSCKICDAPALPDGTKPADVVNKLLLQKVAYKKIQRVTGFDKSLTCRHSQRCVTRAQAGEIKSSYFAPGDSTYVLWPGQTITRNLGPRDWLIKVEYGKGVGDPTKMLTREESDALQLRMKTANSVTPEETMPREKNLDAPEEIGRNT